ncbi:mediator complex subunit 6, partial [Haematococcus lacustris]
MTLYYILDRVVYQAPSLLSALKTRLSRCISAMHSGFAQLQADLDPLARTLKASKAPPQGQQQEAAAGTGWWYSRHPP